MCPRLRQLACVALLVSSFASNGQAQISLAEADQAALEYAIRSKNLPTPYSRVPQIQFATCPPNMVYTTLPKALTGSGFSEPIAIMEPCNFDAQGPDLPLIVAWGGYGISASSFYPGSGIDDEANERGWLCVAVTGLDDQAFGAKTQIYDCQRNVDAAINYMIANYPVDENRIYGVGWSMGAAAMASYAARHLDPNKPMMAALALNAGAFDLIETYYAEPLAFKSFIHILMTGSSTPPPGVGTPTDPNVSFDYERTESANIDPFVGLLDDDRSHARNLAATPIFHTYSTDDIISYLPLQNIRFANYLSNKGANITSTSTSGHPSTHSWLIWDDVVVLDFLSQYSLEEQPASFEVNADRTATYFWADIVQRQTRDFSQVDASASIAPNELSLLDINNVDTLTVRPPAVHFDGSTHFALEVESVDALGFTLIIENIPQEPTYIANGPAVINGQTLFKDWSYDDLTQELTIPIDGAGTFEFFVRFDDYSAELTGNATTPLGKSYHLDMQGSVPNKTYALLMGFDEGVVPLSLIDPLDDRNILVTWNPAPFILNLVLDGAGQDHVKLYIPNNPIYLGFELYFQIVTFPGTTTMADEISNRVDVVFVAPGP